MKSTAELYIASGLSCLPTTKTKLPATKAWKGVDVPVSEFTSFGIAVKCGEASGGLECIDFDNHFGDAKDVVSEFMQMEGIKDICIKYKLPIQTTTGGGFHLMYRCSVIEGNQKLARRPKLIEGKMKPDVLIETRGEGGYFVVDPTPGYRLSEIQLQILHLLHPKSVIYY